MLAFRSIRGYIRTPFTGLRASSTRFFAAKTPDDPTKGLEEAHTDIIDPFKKHTSKYLDQQVNIHVQKPSKAKLKEAGNVGKESMEDVYKGRISGLGKWGGNLLATRLYF